MRRIKMMINILTLKNCPFIQKMCQGILMKILNIMRKNQSNRKKRRLFKKENNKNK
jgi:hypothetical protein